MKVFDVLTESEQNVDEGPLRFAKRTLFKNTTMGKKAQISAEIDAEAKKVYKDLVAAIQNQNDPRLTVGSVADYLQGAGFISGKAEVKKALAANPTFMMRFTKAKDAVADKARSAKDSVANAYGSVKKAVTPDQSTVDKKVNPKPQESLEDLYNSAMLEVSLEKGFGDNTELSNKEVYNVIKGFVKRGRQAKVATGDYTPKSGYGDASKDGNKKVAEPKTPMLDKNVVAILTDLKKDGYELYKDGQKVKF